MWGLPGAATSSHRIRPVNWLGPVNSPERRIEFPLHVFKRRAERRPPPDQHVIMAGAQRARRREPHDLPQPPAHAVAFDRIADLPRHREAHARRAVLVPPPGLHQERLAGRP